MTSREELHRAIEQLSEDQLRQVSVVVEGLLHPDWRRRLAGIPGVRMPAEWPGKFERVDRVRVEGELVSEQLMRERR